ncbi:MAG: glycosyltransferase [Patescibacteria group bacterium]|nr:glycosyltransferase [Patescibacteria group bacterium]
MKIGVDAGALNAVCKSGNYWLSYNLLRQLSLIDRKNQYILYSQKPLGAEFVNSMGNNFYNKVLYPQKFWLQFRLSLEQLIKPVDVFIGLNQALPLVTSGKNVVLVLDLAFEKYPRLFTSRKLSWQTKNAVKKADKIIAISVSTKNDLIKVYKTEPGRIKVIYPG